MLTFVARRVLASIFVLLGASYLMYNLTAYAGDPLADLRASSAPNREQLIESRTKLLDLDIPPPIRFFHWLRDLIFEGNFGVSLLGTDVNQMLSGALGSTLELVVVAAVVSIIVGLSVGIVSALRQYTGFDYAMTFLAFLFYSLPIFWVAVLLKEFGAIEFNNFLVDPTISITATVLLGLLSGLVWSAIVGGDAKRRLITFAVAGAGAAAVLAFISATKWFDDPGLGIVLIALTGVGIAYAVTELSVGIKYRKILYGSLVVVGIGVALYYPLQPVFDDASMALILGLGAVALAVGAIAGFVAGGYDKRQSIRTSMITAFLVSSVILVDRFMQSWPAYVSDSAIGGRPIPTIGSRAPRLDGDFWISGIDAFTHLILPTAALILVSVASYSRYARASLLEVMNQDYIRTARSKGLTERTVIMRHAFRNALIPITTIVAFDIGGLIGGAVITERVFGRPGMGEMFVNALGTGSDPVDLNPAMAFFVVTAIAAVVANMLADLSYAALDPRIRVG